MVKTAGPLIPLLLIRSVHRTPKAFGSKQAVRQVAKRVMKAQRYRSKQYRMKQLTTFLSIVAAAEKIYSQRAAERTRRRGKTADQSEPAPSLPPTRAIGG